ncbi:MAG: hypothetical protein JSW51_03485, partial [Gemmatimonadota bacterium]
DARALLAEELEQRSETARGEGRYEEARAIALRAAWFRVHPKLGEDDPPSVLDPNEGRHLRFASNVWDAYREARAANPDGDIDRWLPYPAESVRGLLRFLLDVGEGTIRSAHVGPGEATPEILEELRGALADLEE